jgi:hypothetical protein
MRIELKRRIKVQAFEVLATFAFPEDRTEILSLLQMANSMGSLNGERVVHRQQGLLPGRPKVMGTRLLNMAVSMDLLDVNRGGAYVLTDFGRENLENETVFVPEKATWTVWVADDPLIPASVIHVERHTEGRPNKNRKDTQALPASLLALNDTKVELFRPHHTKDTYMRIKRIERMGRLSDAKTELEITLFADVGQETILRVSGTLGTGKSNEVSRRIPFEAPPHSELFTMLIDQSEYTKDWNPEESVLSVSFSELNNNERQNHTKRMHVKKPQLEGLGRFNTLELIDIPLKPRFDQDAREWAEWEFWNTLNTHPWDSEIASSWLGIAERFTLSSRGLAHPPTAAERINDLLGMGIENMKVKELTQLRMCQAVSDIGGEPA